MPYNYVRKTDRWVPSRKLEVVEEILYGDRPASELAAENDIPVEEIALWVQRYKRFGFIGLKSTRVQGVRAKERT